MGIKRGTETTVLGELGAVDLGPPATQELLILAARGRCLLARQARRMLRLALRNTRSRSGFFDSMLVKGF